MTLDVEIRPFRMSDYDDVMALWKEAGLPLKPYGRDARDRVEAQVAESNIIFLVAEAEARVAGTVVATHDGRKGWINRLAVRDDCRRRGLGERLVREAEARLEAVGMDVLACLIEEGNEASMRLFARLGYERKDDIHYFVKKKTADS